MSKTLASYLHFFWAGVVKQGQTGAIVPSQRFLIAKMIAPVPEDYDGQIIELGAGNGAITLRLAARCPRARVLACEINPTLARDNRAHLAQAGLHGRVVVVPDSAEHLLSEMRRRGNEPPEYIISGIPLGNLGRVRTLAVLDAVSRSLAPGGIYIQYQHSLLDRKKIKARFPDLRIVPVPLNFPPAVVYYARKYAQYSVFSIQYSVFSVQTRARGGSLLNTEH
jgi:phospholipid N-methyltransferase